MENESLLNEKKYKKSKRKLTIISLIIFILGVVIGGGLIVKGLMNQGIIYDKHKEEEIVSLTEQIENEKQNLIQVKAQFEEKVKPTQDEIKQLKRAEFDGFNDAYYARVDRVEELNKKISEDLQTIDLIENVLNETHLSYRSDVAMKNSYTSKYCTLKLQLEKLTDNNMSGSMPYYIFGIFILMASIMNSGFIMTVAKGRDITSYMIQQNMPVNQEAIEKMTPTVANTTKEVAKAIKDGLNDNK